MVTSAGPARYAYTKLVAAPSPSSAGEREADDVEELQAERERCAGRELAKANADRGALRTQRAARASAARSACATSATRGTTRAIAPLSAMPQAIAITPSSSTRSRTSVSAAALPAA